jgi:hypothetical protein
VTRDVQSIEAPKTSGSSVMVCGDFMKDTRKNLSTKQATSEENSLLVAGHWGGSGDHEHINPYSSGCSMMILGDVEKHMKAIDVEQTLQRGSVDNISTATGHVEGAKS